LDDDDDVDDDGEDEDNDDEEVNSERTYLVIIYSQTLNIYLCLSKRHNTLRTCGKNAIILCFFIAFTNQQAGL
jgi:hypothetical protein